MLFSQTSRVENLVIARREVPVQAPLDMPLEDGSQPAASARFLIEAGIAGREALEINVRRGGREAVANIPKVKILDLRLIGTPAVESAKTSWQNLPERTQARELRQLRLAARKLALDDGVTVEAERELRARLEAIAAKAGCVLVFQTPEAP